MTATRQAPRTHGPQPNVHLLGATTPLFTVLCVLLCQMLLSDMCVRQAAAEKLIQYARNDEEREKLINKHRKLLNDMMAVDDELNDLDVDSDTEPPIQQQLTHGSWLPAATSGSLPPLEIAQAAVAVAATLVGMDKNAN